MSAEEKTYKVKKIVGHRVVQGQVQYRVNWLGYPSSQNSWEPETNLANCKSLIKEYMEQNTVKTRRRSRKPPVRDTSAVLLSSDDEQDGSPVKTKKSPARRPIGRPRKSATPVKKDTRKAGGLFTRSYDLRSSATPVPNLTTLSSDEETPANHSVTRSSLKTRMTLSESKFRKQLNDVYKGSASTKVSTPNKDIPQEPSETKVQAKARLSFDSDSMYYGVRTRSMVLREQRFLEEITIAEAPETTEIAEAPEEEEEQPPSTFSSQDQEADKYPAWLQVGWKEFALATFVTGLAAVGYICYTTEYCGFC